MTGILFSNSLPLHGNKQLLFNMENDKVIYTVITGDYDTIIEPTILTPGWDYYCYTNNPELLSSKEISPNWKFILLEGDVPQIHLSRHPKICFYDHIEERHNLAIYLDANIQIKCNLDSFINDVLKDGDHMCTMIHPTWESVYREADAIKRIGKAKPEVVDRQVNRYREEGFPDNYGQTVANLLVYRNHNTNLIKHCSYWWDEFSNPENAQRDQLGFDYLRWKHQLIKLSRVRYDIIDDNYFKWLPHG